MKQNNQKLAIANKIKKWIKTTKEVETTRFAISITRLTSIKSLCTEKAASEKFALYIAKRVQQQRDQATRPEHFSAEEWEQQKQVVDEAIAQMEIHLESPNVETRQSLNRLLRQIDSLQGDEHRNFKWATIRFVRSEDLLKLEYAMRCFLESDFSYWTYKLAREYVERYDSRYSTGIIPESIPMLLEVAEFWCQYYFDKSLSEKFPDLV